MKNVLASLTLGILALFVSVSAFAGHQDESGSGRRECWYTHSSECTSGNESEFDPTYGRPTLDPNVHYNKCRRSDFDRGTQTFIAGKTYIVDRHNVPFCVVVR